MVGLVNEPPAFLDKYLDMTSPDHSNVYGDFEICPIEPDIPGLLRRACVTGAEKLVVQRVRDSTVPVRLLSTWPRAKVMSRKISRRVRTTFRPAQAVEAAAASFAAVRRGCAIASRRIELVQLSQSRSDIVPSGGRRASA